MTKLQLRRRREHAGMPSHVQTNTDRPGGRYSRSQISRDVQQSVMRFLMRAIGRRRA